MFIKPQPPNTSQLQIVREDAPDSRGHIVTKVRIMFNVDSYLHVVAVTRKWHWPGETYRTEISWHGKTTGLIATAELYAVAMCKAAEIAKELNAEKPTDLPFGSVHNPALIYS